MRINRDRRGISNVIVVMLSLVLIVVVVANVVLWSYQMNQLDWEKMREKVEIVDVARVNSSPWFVAQSEYDVNIGSRIGGTYTDTQAIDDQYERFTEPLVSTYYPNSYNVVSGNWWNLDWEYRRPLMIDNTQNTNNLTDYQVKVFVDTASLIAAGKMRSDCGDVRFTDSDGITLINYWIESGINSSSTKIWIKVPSISASSTKMIYMYYGNSDAASASNITGVLEATYTKIIVSFGWEPRVSTTDVADGDDAGSWQNFPFNFPYWREFKSRAYICSNGFAIFDPTATTNDYTDSLSELQARWKNAPFWDDLRTDTAGGIVSSPGAYVDSYGDHIVVTWETTRYGASTDSIKFQTILYRNGDIRINIENATNFSNFTPTLGISKGDNVNYIDITSERATFKSWLFLLRKYTSPEPTTTVGDEETSYHVSGNVPGSLQNVDSDYLIIKSTGSVTTATSYYPSGYALGGSTTWVSGDVSNLTSNDGVYMTFRSQGGGLNWFLNSDSKVYTPAVGSWQDVNVSADTDIPAGATGLVLEIVNENATTPYIGQVRAKGSTDDRTSGAKVRQSTQIMAFVRLDANKTFQAYRDSVNIKFYVRGYADSSVTFFTNWNDVAGGHTAYTWYTVDVSGYGVPGNSIIILELYNHDSNTYAGLRFRRNGDTDYATYGQAGTVGAHQFIMVGVDANSKFQHYKSNNDYNNFFLVGYIQNVGTWRGPPSADVSGTTTGVWTDRDITAETSSNAIVALIYVRCGWVDAQPKKADFRKNGSSDDQYAYGEHWYDLPASSIFYVVGLDENQTFETKIESAAIDIFVLGYLEPTLEVEFIGSSNTNGWTQLEWTIDSAWTIGSVSATLQLYNYYLGSYPASGDGYMSYTSSATANTDETKSQMITINPTHFRNATGYWKMKVKGIKATTTEFNFKADWIEFKPTYYSEYTVSTEFLFSSMTKNTPTQLNFTIVSQYNIASVSVTIQVWNYSSSAYVTSDEGYLTYTSSGSNETKLLSINTNPQFYASNGNAKIKVTGIKSTTTQYQQKTNQIKLDYQVENRLEVNGIYVIDLSTYPLTYIQTVEIQLGYRASDGGEKWYLKAYNWTAMTYSDIGFNSTTGHTPTTGWDYYAVNLTTSWGSYVWNNGTIYVKIVDEGPDSNRTTIDIDFLGVRAAIDGARFTFKNEGPLTLHLVSLWVINSTIHRRYDLDVFINSADTLSYIRADISLPSGQYTVKVVTERGNIAVYSGS